MAEPVQISPEQEAVDLSAGKLPEQEKQLQNKLIELYNQRRKQRESLFWAALLFSAVMSSAFLVFGYRLMCLIEANSGLAPDWHFILLGSGLIIPPTIVLFGLLRRLYEPEANGNSAKDKGAESPAEEVLAEVSGMVKSLTEMVGAITEKFVKPGG